MGPCKCASSCIFSYILFDYLILTVVYVVLFCSQIDISGNRKAVVIHVPYRLRKAFRKIHLKLVRELEKKFSGKVTFLFHMSLCLVYKWQNIYIEIKITPLIFLIAMLISLGRSRLISIMLTSLTADMSNNLISS